MIQQFQAHHHNPQDSSKSGGCQCPPGPGSQSTVTTCPRDTSDYWLNHKIQLTKPTMKDRKGRPRRGTFKFWVEGATGPVPPSLGLAPRFTSLLDSTQCHPGVGPRRRGDRPAMHPLLFSGRLDSIPALGGRSASAVILFHSVSLCRKKDKKKGPEKGRNRRKY